jgi:phosphotransferase system HPr (HPr) family protein
MERVVRIVNPEGLHARPSGAIVSAALRFESALRVAAGDREVNGRSILEVISLGATCGTDLVLRADGPDAEALLDELEELVAGGFDGAG